MKKILLAILFSAFLCINANAASTYYAINTGALNWSDKNSWNTSSNQASGNAAAAPTSADTCYLDGYSSAITVDTTSCKCGTIIATGYTQAWNIPSGKTLIAYGNVTFPSGAGGTITGTGILDIASVSLTITPNGITFPGSINFDIQGTEIVTLGGNLIVSGTISNFTNLEATAITFSGGYNVTCANLILVTNTISSNFLTIPAGQTLTITTSFTVSGLMGAWGSGAKTLYNFVIKSGTASSYAYLNYTGSPENLNISGAKFTDVNASGSTSAIFNYGGSTLLRTTNIYNITQANMGGIFIP